MNFLPIVPCTRRMGSPEGMEDECGTLEICDVHDPIWGNVMRSAWRPDPDELLAIMGGAPIILQIVGHRHPIVALFMGQMASVDEPAKTSDEAETNKPAGQGEPSQ